MMMLEFCDMIWIWLKIHGLYFEFASQLFDCNS